MSVNDLVNRLQEMPVGGTFDFQEIRDSIHREADQPCTTEERVTLIRLFNAVLDKLERDLSVSDPDKLGDLKNVRLADYRLLLIKEARVGENICVDTIYAITDREIAAGRMAPDDDLRITAAEGFAKPHPTREEMIAIAEGRSIKIRGFFGRLFRA